MNQLVPGFHEIVGSDDCSDPASSNSSKPNKHAICDDDDVMELLWENGQVVVQRSTKKVPFSGAAGGDGAADQLTVRGVQPSAEELHLFMQEDEMASWLQYPMDDSSLDRDLYSDLLHSSAPPPIPVPITTIAPPRTVAEIRPDSSRPPIPLPLAPPAKKPDNFPRYQNFVHFSRLPIRPRIESNLKPNAESAVREATVVESNETPAVERESRISPSSGDLRTVANTENRAAAVSVSAATTREFAAVDTFEVTVSSSADGSGSSFSGERLRSRHQPMPADDRKRKKRVAFSSDYQSEEIEFKFDGTKGSGEGAAWTKKRHHRAAEVHNLSERRRRDRINEKMKTLQQLIPRCNKTDKASMLDEAIVYLRSLQLQVQMMSMGCGMVPMMFPGMQRFVAPMGIGLGMGMGMGMAMNRPLLPYPASMLPVSGTPANMAPMHMNPRFHAPPDFHPSQPEPSRAREASGQGDRQMAYSPFPANLGPNQPPMLNCMFQFPGLHQASLPSPQNRAGMQPTIVKSDKPEV